MSNKKNPTTFVTRVLSGICLFPIIACLLVFANNLIMDITIAIISMIAIYEYYNCFKSTNKANPSQWLGMIICALTAFVHFIDEVAFREIMIILIPVCIFALVIELLCAKGKKNIIDIAITLLGICYIPMMLVFISIIRANFVEGKILVWYIFFSAWGSDTFAYLIGKNFGKHKLTRISKGKTIEGAIAGIIGAVIVSIIYTIAINSIFSMQINIGIVSIITTILSIVGQIGDLAASSVKRYCNIKDFSDLIPGHGGMIDRIDSVIFIAPVAYILLGMLV